MPDSKLKEGLSVYRSSLIRLLYCILGALATQLIFSPKSFENSRSFLIIYFLNLGIWVSQWFGAFWIVKKIRQRFSWEENPPRTALIIILSCLAYSAVALMIFLVPVLLYSGVPVEVVLKDVIPQYLLFAVVISLIIGLVYQALNFFWAWQAAQYEAEKLRSEMLSYRYEALRQQLNPHFLFNTFANLTYLIDEDSDSAKQYVEKLSTMFRYILSLEDKQMVTLEEEVRFAKEYAFLMENRAQGALRYVFEDIDFCEEEFLVPMSLQLLLENAEKHNQKSTSRPLVVRISKEMDHICVENEIVFKKSNRDSSHIGLQNLRDQYAYLSDRTIQVSNADDRFVVRLPILHHS